VREPREWNLVSPQFTKTVHVAIERADEQVDLIAPNAHSVETKKNNPKQAK
jgi:hypothetical protein